MKSEKEERIQTLVATLNSAAVAYYGGREIMSNFEYDRLYDELLAMEKETGIILKNSPSQRVGAPVLESLAKKKHEYPALSLDKTKDMELFIQKFRNLENLSSSDTRRGYGEILMWKMDGSTLQLGYENGVLQYAATRGDGETGNVVTHNAEHIVGIPRKIAFKGNLIVRGEAVMSYQEFERLNAELPAEERYANSRNLANATVSMLDAGESAKREIQFFAFNLVYTDAQIPTPEKSPYPFGPKAPGNMLDSFEERLLWLKELGFQVVPFESTSADRLKEAMLRWEGNVRNFGFPVDGLVVALDDTVYASAQPGTGHNPHVSQGYAFKWQDETQETVLREIEFSLGRTGALTPVAVFDPVQLEGTVVERASLHNAGYVLQMDLKPGDRITVYKANKIIPQISENLNKQEDWNPADGIAPSEEKMRRNHIPEFCPICGAPAVRAFATDDNCTVTGTFVALCNNPNCSGMLLKKFGHFVDRDCMDITGLSEKTLEKMIAKGWIREYADLYHLGDPENRDILQQMIDMDGAGVKSVEKLLKSISESRRTDFVSFLHALGIPNVGKGQAKLLKNWLLENYRKTYCIDHQTVSGPIKDTLFDALVQLVFENFDFTQIDGIGPVIANSISEYILHNVAEPQKIYFEETSELLTLLEEVTFADEWTEESGAESESAFAGKTFVITGKVEHFPNREALQSRIEALGGKTSGSVSKNTDYLINNDVESTSGKNKKAMELGVPVISEEDFLRMAGII